MNQTEKALRQVCRGWAPPPKESLSEWAEAHFRLSPEYSAQTGPLRLYQFQRGPLDAFTDPYTREVVVMSATQMLKTLVLQCCVAYAIARDPGPILMAQPTETDAETFSKERLAPMIRDMDCLRDKVSPEKKTSKSNTTLHKVFDGGSLTLIGAQTAGNFARRSVRYFMADERDKWPRNVGKEGDGYSLGVKRQATFRSRAKRVQVCSPTIDGDSQIAAAYELSDQRKFWVPCPACGQHQVLAWSQVTWDESDPIGTARYNCEHCKAKWDDVSRWQACERGEWRASRPFTGIAGFWISELYSPWKKLGELAVDFLAKKDIPEELQTFVNTSLAETWKVRGEAPDHEKLMARREDGNDGRPAYRMGQVPKGVLFLTSGVDVQKSWLEGYVWGWGRGRQRWLIDHFRVEHSPFEAKSWDGLTEQLNRTYRHECGADLSILRMCVDTGFVGNEVYLWARQQGSGRVMAVDGRTSGASLVGLPSQVDVTIGGRRIKHGAKIWPVNVSACKSELYGLLGKERPSDGEPYPAGWVHFPSDAPEEFFKQITAESLQTRVVKGYRKTEWVKDPSRRNEALDCYDYARAGAFVVGMDRRANDSRWWSQLEQALGSSAPDIRDRQEAPALPAQSTPAPVKVASARQPSGWLGERTQNWFGR